MTIEILYLSQSFHDLSFWTGSAGMKSHQGPPRPRSHHGWRLRNVELLLWCRKDSYKMVRCPKGSFVLPSIFEGFYRDILYQNSLRIVGTRHHSIDRILDLVLIVPFFSLSAFPPICSPRRFLNYRRLLKGEELPPFDLVLA